MKLYKNLKKIYKKINFIADILLDLIISYVILTELYNRNEFSVYSVIYLLLGLSLFIEAIRRYLKKRPILLPLFKQIKTILFTFILSLVFLTQGDEIPLEDVVNYDYGMSSIPFLLAGLLFFTISLTICTRKILNKPSLGDLFKQFINRYKK